MLSNMVFEYPYAFLLLVVFFICENYCKKRSTKLYFSNLAMLQSVVKKQNYLTKSLRYLLVFCMVLALSSPIIKENITLKNADGYEILLAIDASDSMKDENRFEITKKIVSDFVDKREYDRLALSVFAAYSYIAVPFTYDKQPLKDILKYIQIGAAGTWGTALYEALYQSGKLFEKSKAKNKIVILLTDGINTKDNIPLDIAIANAKKYGLKVYTIAIGDKEEYHGEVLSKIAKETRGEFFETSDLTKLEQIYSTIDSLEKSKIETSHISKKTYYFQYPLALAILFFIVLYGLNRGRV